MNGNQWVGGLAMVAFLMTHEPTGQVDQPHLPNQTPPSYSFPASAANNNNNVGAPATATFADMTNYRGERSPEVVELLRPTFDGLGISGNRSSH